MIRGVGGTLALLPRHALFGFIFISFGITLILCILDESPCSVNNGECDQVCYHDNVAVTCDCYSGYSLINNTACLINYNYGMFPLT